MANASTQLPYTREDAKAWATATLIDFYQWLTGRLASAGII